VKRAWAYPEGGPDFETQYKWNPIMIPSN